MSQERWHHRFMPAAYGAVVDAATGPSRSVSTLGQVSTADLAMHEVAHYLRQSAVHQAIFGGRILAQQIADPERFTKFPLLTVCLASIANEERPTSVSEESVTVYVQHWWDQLIAEPVPDGQATIATMHWHTKRVLHSNQALTLVLWWNGETRSLSSQPVKIGPERYGRFEVAKGRLAFLSEIPFTYTIRTDRTTGQPINFQ